MIDEYYNLFTEFRGGKSTCSICLAHIIAGSLLNHFVKSGDHPFLPKLVARMKTLPPLNPMKDEYVSPVMSNMSTYDTSAYIVANGSNTNNNNINPAGVSVTAAGFDDARNAQVGLWPQNLNPDGNGLYAF